MQAWVDAFAEVGKESGLSPSAVRIRGEDAIARIEGSLILARVLGDNTAFERNIKLLPDLLIGNQTALATKTAGMRTSR
jgi:TetR/AcrR family transcriptional regulator, lmrAB and yxaGH operons repressor